jgi:predicted AAA+ superfamily ATPase
MFSGLRRNIGEEGERVELKSFENTMSVLLGFNIWWRLGHVDKEYVKPFRRGLYYQARRVLAAPGKTRLLRITGPNRVGKSVVLHQLIQGLLDQGVSPQRILYLPCGHALLHFLSISETLNFYRENICGEDDVLFFFDDIQLVKNSQAELARALKDWPCARFTVASTVESTSEEGGVSREDSGLSDQEVWRLHLPTLSFYEYCRIAAPKDTPDFKGKYLPWELFRISRREAKELFHSLSGSRRLFLRYLHTGGFPGLAAIAADKIRVRQLLQEGVVSVALHLDIPTNIEVRDIYDLDTVYYALCMHSGEIIAFHALAKEIGYISRPTVEKYVHCLERANLIYFSRPVTFKGNRFCERRPKSISPIPP